MDDKITNQLTRNQIANLAKRRKQMTYHQMTKYEITRQEMAGNTLHNDEKRNVTIQKRHIGNNATRNGGEMNLLKMT